LTPAQSAQLRSGAEIRLSSADGTLPAPLVEAVKQAAEELERPGRNGNREVQQIVTAVKVRAAGPGAAPGDAGPALQETNVSIRISDAASYPPRPVVLPVRGVPRLQLHFTLTSVEGTQNARRMRPVMWSPEVAPAPAGPRVAVATSQDPALQREVDLPLSKPPAGSPPSPTAAAGAASMLFFGSGRDPRAGMPTLGEVGEAIHRAAGLEIVADSFIRDRLNSAGLTGRRPLAQILDTIGREMEYDGAKESNLLAGEAAPARFATISLPRPALPKP
jgi:hypothetical protein